MESQRAAAAAKEAAARRALGPQIIEGSVKLVETWNARQAAHMPMLFSPTIEAAITAGYWFLRARCPACRTTGDVDLRTLDWHRGAAVTALTPRCLAAPAGRTLRSLNCCLYRRTVLSRSITQSAAATGGSVRLKMVAWFGETFYWTATVIAGLLLAWVLWSYSFNGTGQPIILIVPLLLAAVIWLTAWACRKVLE
jgi:hypothetical protein